MDYTPSLPSTGDGDRRSRLEAAHAGSRLLIAYDLALRIKGLHLAPTITEEEALDVYRLAQVMETKLNP